LLTYNSCIVLSLHYEIVTVLFYLKLIVEVFYDSKT